MELEWELHGPSPDSFEAITGDAAEYTVHLATAGATTDSEISDAILEVVDRALAFPTLIGLSSPRLLVLWDAVYAHLTAVYTDESMFQDGPQVAKCAFPRLAQRLDEISDEPDWERASGLLAERVETLLAGLVESGRLAFPSDLSAYFSRDDRGSCGPAEFQARKLAGRSAGIRSRPAPEGRDCTSLVAREFELHGELVSRFVCVFLGTKDGAFKIYLDDESLCWKLEATDENPRPSDVEGDADFRFPHRDLAVEFDVLGETIGRFSESDAGNGARALLPFSSGRVLELSYDYKPERTTARLLAGIKA